MKEFFGFGGYERLPEGFFSWQHIAFVSTVLLVAVLLAVVLGRKNQKRTEAEKNRVLVVSAILLDAIELIRIVIVCFREGNAMNWIYNLPLFLCSIQLIVLPLAAFSKGRMREAALDFVSIFGALGMVLGMYGAGQNYNAYPVLSFDNVFSALTHSIAGFAALYIMIVGLASMKRENIWITFAILMGFCVTAYAVNLLIGYNYMFLMRHDGTPYQIVYDFVGGSPVLYPLAVVGLFLVYITVFYGVWFMIAGAIRNAERAAGKQNGLKISI